MKQKAFQKLAERYQAPNCEILSISMEGVLCQSGGSSVYNNEGLRDISDDNVEDLSNGWGFQKMCLMKNLIKSMALLAVAAMGLSACNEQNLTPEQVGKGELVTVHFGANSSIESPTKATLTTQDEKTFKSAWEDGDVLSVEYSNDGATNATGKVEAKWVDATSSFDTTLPEYTGTWTYDAVYPAPNAKGEVDFGSARVQNGNAYNSKYDLMFGEAVVENAPAGKTDDGKDVIFNMDRQTGIVYFHLTSALDEEVVSATLSVSEPIASSLVMPNNEYSKGFDISLVDLKDITITFAEGTAPKASDFKLWFNVIPTPYETMSLHVETTGHTLDISCSAKGGMEEFVAGKLYKTVATVPDTKWVAKVAEIPVYASLADLVAAGAPTTAGAQVTVTLTDEVIKTFNGTKGINILVGEQAIQLYCKSTAFPTEWTEGGTLSGTLTNCEWVLYGGNTWELCPSNWDELTYKAPESPIEIPVYASLAELIAAGAPTTAGEQVTVTLTDEEITGLAKSSNGKYTNGVFLKVGEQEIEIYCRDVPSTWEVGGKISGVLTNCKWMLYVDKSENETWELYPDSWDVFTYTAPLPTCATPVIDIDKTTGAATITCETTGATIHYTVGESPADPTENDAVYSSAVTLTDGQTIKAIAIADGYKPSAIASKKYVVGVETKTIEIDLSKQSYNNGQAVESLSVEPITIKFDKGTNSNVPKYYTSGNAVRCYGGNSFTISGATIQEVKITFGSDDKENEISSDKGNYKDGTWTGSESEVKFTIGGTSGHRRIAKLAITYIE